MKIFTKVLTVFMTLVFSLSVFSACGGEQEYDYLIAGGTLMCEGECVITLYVSDEYSLHDPNVVLSDVKESVSVDDIVLTGAVAGKRVKAVNLVSPRELEVTLDGDITKPTEGEHSTIKIKGSAMENGVTYSAVLSPDQFFGPYLFSLLLSTPEAGEREITFGVSAMYCQFTEITSSMISIDVSCSALTVTQNSATSLRITLVSDYSTWPTDGATLTFSPSATTTNKPMSVKVK